MNKQKHECTKHIIKLCPDNKEYVLKIWASFRRQASISDAINKIIDKAKESSK